MENTIKRGKIHPVKGELRLHWRSTLVVLALSLLAGYLNIKSQGAFSEDWYEDADKYIDGLMIVIGCGFFVVAQAFDDAFRASARDVMQAHPMTAGARYRTKIWMILIRHIGPVILSSAVFLAIGHLSGANTREVFDQACKLVTVATLLDSILVLIFSCTGTLGGALVFGAFVGYILLTIIFSLLDYSELLERIFYQKVYLDLGVVFVSLLIAVALFLCAGLIYVRRDGRHTGQFMTGTPALEVLFAGVLAVVTRALLDNGPEFGMIIVAIVYFAVHVIIFRKSSGRKILAWVAIYIGVTGVCVATMVPNYINYERRREESNEEYRSQFRVVQENFMRTDSRLMMDQSYLAAHPYLTDIVCELQIGIHRQFDTYHVGKYLIYNADGSTIDEQQYYKIVNILKIYCSQNEYEYLPEVSFREYLFHDDLPESVGIYWQYGFQLTASFDVGLDAERRQCTGYIMSESEKQKVVDLLKQAGFVVREQ